MFQDNTKANEERKWTVIIRTFVVSDIMEFYLTKNVLCYSFFVPF